MNSLNDKMCKGPRIVVVGAGLAGLNAALELCDRGAQVEILEASEVPGGNAWRENWGDLKLPTAGSCFRAPLPGGRTEALLTRLNLSDQWRTTSDAMQVLFRTSALLSNVHELTAAFLRHPGWLLKAKVWGLTGTLLLAALRGQPLVPAEKALGEPIFASLYRFLDRLGPSGGHYPAVPWTPECGITRSEMEALDRLTIRQFLFEPSAVRDLPSYLRPPRGLGRLVKLAVTTTLEVEGLLLDNCSAYVGLHFLVGYLNGDLVAMTGGNGAVAEAMLAQFLTQPGARLRTGAEVTGIQVQNNGCRVQFGSRDLAAEIECDGVVVAAPKHAALRFLPGLPEAQRAAMEQIEYSDYAIANVRLSEPAWVGNFGGYFIGDYPEKDAQAEFCLAGGIVNAGWKELPGAAGGRGFSFLKPVPQRADQGKLVAAHPDTLRAEAEVEIRRALTAVGAVSATVQEVRVHAWPRGLVSPRPGQMANDIFVQASAPYGRITFANQDSAGVGSLESAIESGARAAAELAGILMRTESGLPTWAN